MNRVESSGRPVSAILLELAGVLTEMPREELPGFLAELERVRVAAWLRLVVPPEPRDRTERLLTAAAASEILGTSEDWLRRHQHRLPFLVRVGGQVRFSSEGIARWIRSREGR